MSELDLICHFIVGQVQLLCKQIKSQALRTFSPKGLSALYLHQEEKDNPVGTVKISQPSPPHLLNATLQQAPGILSLIILSLP